MGVGTPSTRTRILRIHKPIVVVLEVKAIRRLVTRLRKPGPVDVVEGLRQRYYETAVGEDDVSEEPVGLASFRRG